MLTQRVNVLSIEIIDGKVSRLLALSGVEPRCRKRVINNLPSLPPSFFTMIYFFKISTARQFAISLFIEKFSQWCFKNMELH